MMRIIHNAVGLSHLLGPNCWVKLDVDCSFDNNNANDTCLATVTVRSTPHTYIEIIRGPQEACHLRSSWQLQATISVCETHPQAVRIKSL